MFRRAVLVSVFAFWMAISMAAEDGGLTAFLGRIAAEQPSVKWDAKSAVEGDFDGSHHLGFAALGYKDERVMVAVGHKAADGSMIAQYLSFGIDHIRTASVCTVPAHLEVHPLTCANEEEPLPGCKEAPGVSGLSLADDECDPINMYWDHSKKRMAWWRN